MSKIQRKYIPHYIILILGCLIFIYPIFYAFGVGFFTAEDFARTPPSIIPITDNPYFENYKTLLLLNIKTDPNIGYFYLNSIVRVVWYIVIVVLSSFIGGYVYSRLKFPGKKITFAVLLTTTMIPPVTTMAPTYLMIVHFPLVGGNNIWGQGGSGFLDTYSVLIILGLVNVLGMFLVRMSLNTFPKALEESAKIDGAGIFRIMFQIVFPIQKPILAYIAITTGIAVWNDWYTPFVYTNGIKLQTLASAIGKMTSVAVGQYGIPDWPGIITLGLGLTIPSLIMFAFFQRYIVEGLAAAAVKG